MSSMAMRKMELLLLKSDIDVTLQYLGGRHCFQVIYPETVGRQESGAKKAKPGEGQDADFSSRLDAALQKLNHVGEFLAFREPGAVMDKVHLPDEELLEEVERLSGFCAEAENDIALVSRKLDELEESLHEARAFAGLSLPFDDLNKFSFITLRIGTVDAAKLPGLVKALDERAMIIPIDEEGTVIAAASRKGRFALETELSKAGFVKRIFPPDFKGVPSDALQALESAYNAEKHEMENLLARKEALAGRYAATWPDMVSSLKLGKALKRVEQRLEGTEWAYRLSGWVPSDKVKSLVKDIGTMLGERVGIRIYDPEDKASGEKTSEQEVPVLMKHGTLVSGFQPMVLSYGTPLYGDIDPTPIVAFFFTLLFAIMFGDVGQGAVILVLGFAIRKAKKGFLAGYQSSWSAFVAAGAGSMIMGLVVGSFFANEEILIPLERVLTRLVLGQPRDRFLKIMPQGNLNSMFYFFGFTLAVGVLINSTGIIVNIVNLIRRKEIGEALFSKTGLSGATLFWWAIGMAVRILLGRHLQWFDIVGLGVPLLAIFLSEPLKALVDSRHGKGEKEKISIVGALVGGAVEIIETFSYYASNTMSFLRVAAFALAHAVLSFVIFTMADLVRTRIPGGLVFQILVFIVGNVVIIGLEGLIVTIQVIRLQYYEFFSKFFTRTGKAFEPMRFDA